MPHQYIDDPIKQIHDFTHFQQILETKKFLIIRYEFYKVKNSLVLINKVNRKSSLSYYSSDDLRGFKNDLDAGMRFQPRGYIVENGNEYLIELKEAFKIKAYAASDMFKNNVAKNPESKDRFEQLVANLRESDNPVLMFVKLK